MSVLLPAPFSPISECTSPGKSLKSTLSSAFTPAKAFSMPLIVRTGDVSAIASLDHCRGEMTASPRQRRWEELLVLPGREGHLRLLRREGGLLRDDALRDLLAGDDLLRHVHQLRPEERAALGDEVDLTLREGAHAVVDSVDRDDLDVLAGPLAGFLDRLDGTETLVVVVREEEIDVRVRLEEARHDLLAARTREVTGLRRDDLQVRVALDGGAEARRTVDRRGRACRALDLDDVHLVRRALVGLRDVLAGEPPLADEVRSEEAHVERLVLRSHRAVGEDHRDVRSLGLSQDRVPTRLDDRRERDHRDVLLDVRPNRRDLILLLLLRVRELQRDPRGLRGFLDRLRVGRAPAALRADLRETEHDLLLRRARLARGDSRKDGACEHDSAQKRKTESASRQ